MTGFQQPCYFNSQPHEEADVPGLPSCQMFGYFNSQPHEEADISRRICHTERIYFNSQPHEEADRFIDFVQNDIGISTHSLTKRLTKLSTLDPDTLEISTHSLTKRLTLHIVVCYNIYIYFNSQPHEEADL